MAFSDLLDKVKQWAGKNPGKAHQGVDRGASALKRKFAGHDKHFDTASDKAKNYLTGPGERQQGQTQAPGTQPPPPAPGTQSPPA